MLGCLMPTIYPTGEGMMPALVTGMAQHATPYTGQMRSTTAMSHILTAQGWSFPMP